MSNYTKQKPDANKAAFVAALKRVGWYPQSMMREDGFDLLVHGAFGVLPILLEAKSLKGDLTSHEQAVKLQIEQAGGVYPIARFAAQIESLIALGKRAQREDWRLSEITAALRELELK